MTRWSTEDRRFDISTWRLRALVLLGATTVVVGGLLAAVRLDLIRGWDAAAPWLAVAGTMTGGSTTLVTALYESRREAGRTRRDEIDRLVDGVKWQLFTEAQVAPFDVGVAVWTVRRDWLRRVRRAPRRLTDTAYRSRARNRHASTGIQWTVGKGVIGRCIETSSVLGIDLEDLWRHLRGCDEATWLAEPEVDVRQRLTYQEFVKAQGSDSDLTSHLNYVLAVPILPQGGRGVLGCVALDIPPQHVPAGVSEGHYMVEGVRGIADALGSP